MKKRRIALVADWIVDYGGAERVFEKLVQMFPDADIYTSVFWQHDNPVFEGRAIFTSFLQKIPILGKRHKLVMWLRPLAFESFNLSGYDLVISSSSAEAKGVITHPGTIHICYCHTPTRYLWSHADEYQKSMEFGMLNPLAKLALKMMLGPMRRWDKAAGTRPDYYIANSKTVAQRIEKYYGRESEVIYPFFKVQGAKCKVQDEEQRELGTLNFEFGTYYFAVGRCIPYKKFDLLVDTFNENGKNLVIATATNTPLYRKLKKRSKKNITWIFGADDEKVARLFENAKAYLMPQEEDFGITPIEAMSHGCPVIAYRAGGATETVVEDATGVFFGNQNPTVLGRAIERFEKQTWDRAKCKVQSAKFGEERFEKELREFVEKVTNNK